MRALLICVIIFISGCKTLPPINFDVSNEHHQEIAFHMAISFLELRGYQIDDKIKKPTIAIHSSTDALKTSVGLSKEYYGWYDPATEIIHISKGVSSRVLREEICHYMLCKIGIPPVSFINGKMVEVHHEIIRRQYGKFQ